MALSNDLYNMEGEYKIMNSEIEAKAAEFLKKADEIVRNQEESIELLIKSVSENENACGDSVRIDEIHQNFRSDTESSSSETDNQLTHRILRDHDSPVSNNETSSYLFRLRNGESEPQRHQVVSPSDGVKLEREHLIINSLKAKIRTFQEECLKKNEQLKKRNYEMESMKKTNQRLQEEKMKLYSQINGLKSQTAKFELKFANLTQKIQSKENECKTLCSENEALNKSVKESKQTISRLEVRLARALDDYATASEQLSEIKTAKKDLAENTKKKMDELTTDLERSKRKNQTAMTALVKQAQLVDNLKRQIANLKAAKEIKNVDERLDNLLQWSV